MKMTKRLIALLLAVIMIAAIPFTAFAAKDAKEETTAAAEEETTAAPAEPKENLRDTVAKMWVFVTFANPKVPHCWIYIKNLTDKPLKVCDDYYIKAHGDFSMGAFKERGTDGAGIYFNLERHWIKPETYGRAYCMATNVSRKEMNKLPDALKRHNYWNWGFNCCWFATCIWNLASPRKLAYLFSPYIMVGQMLIWGAKRPDFVIPKMTNAAYCYKYSPDGIKQCCYRATISNTGV